MASWANGGEPWTPPVHWWRRGGCWHLRCPPFSCHLDSGDPADQHIGWTSWVKVSPVGHPESSCSNQCVLLSLLVVSEDGSRHYHPGSQSGGGFVQPFKNMSQNKDETRMKQAEFQLPWLCTTGQNDLYAWLWCLVIYGAGSVTKTLINHILWETIYHTAMNPCEPEAFMGGWDAAYLVRLLHKWPHVNRLQTTSK